MSNETKGPSVAEIVANPEKFGFVWTTDKVAKGDVSWNVPLVKHMDVDLLRATFGDTFFLASADGTSRHVTNQRIARDMKYEKATATDLQIKTAIVENMLGMKSKRRTVVEVKKYIWGGNEYDTRDAAVEQARADLAAKGYPAELIEDVVTSI